MMGGRRWRRVTPPQTLLPLQRVGARVSHTVSCWYCDIRIIALNRLLYSIGRRHARILRIWYAIGVGFGLLILTGVSLTLLVELVRSLHLGGLNKMRAGILVSLFFGIGQSYSLSLSVLDAAIMGLSTLVSVVIHELGHALAAASHGIQMEYVALFLALLFPGAFVAFNYEVLHNSSLMTSLRVYCAGIWHNVVFCAICGSALFFLPSVLHPFYMHGQSPVVLDVAPSSPLSGYLSQGDVIVSLDGTFIHSPQEWTDKLLKINSQLLHGSMNSEYNRHKGYCVANSRVEKYKFPPQRDLSCPDELEAFMKISCISLSPLQESNLTVAGNVSEGRCCLSVKDVVELPKCGGGWEKEGTHGTCSCLEQDESCMAPVQAPGLAWVEISFLGPNSSECLHSQTNHSSLLESSTCGGTFVFIGNIAVLLDTVLLSAYKPRWMGIGGLSYLPIFLEKLLSCMLHVSASLALFNSLPAFLLDGESIVEACFLSIAWLRLRTRRRLTKLVLYGGTLLIVYMLMQIVLVIFRKPF